MNSAMRQIIQNLESLPASLLKEVASALGESKSGTKKILAERIFRSLSQNKILRGKDREMIPQIEEQIVSTDPGQLSSTDPGQTVETEEQYTFGQLLTGSF